MMKLYYAPRTRAVRPRWLLEEMGIPYDLVRLNMAEVTKTHPEYQTLHPHGAVPTLQDGNLTLIESGAICQYLTEKYPDKKMAPLPGTPTRALYLQWMFYCPGTFEGPFTQLFQQTRGLPEAERTPGLADKLRGEFGEVLGFLENMLKTRQFLCGDEFTAADIMLGHSLLNAKRYEMIHNLPNLERYLDVLGGRPARLRATQD